MSWQLIAKSEPIAGQTLDIDRDMVIGRHQQADIVLQAAHISRRHAALIIKENQLWIQDLGSSNGTFVNGQRVTEQQLQDHDEIHFENIRFQVVETLGNSQSDNAPDVEQKAAITIEKVIPSDEGMPTIEQRGMDVVVDRDGMPKNISVPKPAPIPDHIDVQATSEPKPMAIPEPESRIEQVEQEKKNAKVGLMSMIILVIIAVIAAAIFLGQ
ncbi:FHA domain-containing protein [Acinetobacter qingfengensis]|uniref:FHA domain-containing protein n=1 Tax=Acinetobacter qingfengensis TaxID=1262585 RepID=A0A1E7RDA1_9GAMM|nr:FHA domain-containing protein [Acinetobacter qingfengensis]KAA8732347.1 FHA domain-containing protein [Acinetobacter qingfengensis]OEY97256.1 hypothetical protein BJI46_02210 [Acinetobacter qingfengensis]